MGGGGGATGNWATEETLLIVKDDIESIEQIINEGKQEVSIFGTDDNDTVRAVRVDQNGNLGLTVSAVQNQN